MSDAKWDSALAVFQTKLAGHLAEKAAEKQPILDRLGDLAPLANVVFTDDGTLIEFRGDEAVDALFARLEAPSC